MHDAGAELAADAAQAAHVKEEGVDERAVAVAGGGMNDQAGGLVDHDEVVIFEDNRERQILRRGGGGGGRRHVEVDLLSRADPE